jgi:IclR family transcriptional regulator, KDG regulon repressor
LYYALAAHTSRLGVVTAAADRSSGDDRVQAVERAAELLKAIATTTESQTARELATRCALNRTTAWRLLVTLEHCGLVERNSSTQRYSIGYGLVALASAPSARTALVRAARPVLERLIRDVPETINLSVAAPDAVIAIDQLDPPHPVQLVNYINEPLPLHCTSNGKVLLATWSPDELDKFLARRLPRLTDQTLTDPDRLRACLDTVRHSGYATTIGEVDPSINGASAGIRGVDGAMVATVSVSGPAFRLTEQRLHEIAPRVRDAAAEIAARIRAAPGVPGHPSLP